MECAIRSAENAARAEALFKQHQKSVYKRADVMFASLLVFEWLGGILAALLLSPQTWNGATTETHIHVWLSLFLGGAIVALPLLLIAIRPGSAITRHCVAIAQMLMSALLIHVSGGRIETHFHVFGSLAFLAFYRDWRVLITASVVVALDHVVRGFYMPQSVYGVSVIQPWRWVEHAAWVVFEDIILILTILQTKREMRNLAERQAQMEALNAEVESRVIQRTAELAASEERFKSLSASSPVVVFEADHEGNFMYVNSKWESITGCGLSEALGAGWRESIHAEDRAEFTKLWHEAMSGNGQLSTELRLVTASDELRWVHLIASVSAGDRVIGTINDITERKDVEKRVNEFYSMVSHELRTPLCSIRGALGLMESGTMGELPGGCVELLEIGRLNCDRLIRLINDILDLRKIEAGKLELSLQEVSAERLASFSADGVKSFGVENGVRVRTEVTDGVILDCDIDRIIQVLTNFLSNAIKFSPENSEVLVTGNIVEPGIYRFSVIDKGPGIPEDQYDKLFQKFQQLDSSDMREKGGTGLGLAISKAIVEEHGGTIGFDSVGGEGATFWFELPCTLGKTVFERKGHTLTTGNGTGSPLTLLIIEDNKDIAKILITFAESEGYTCKVAASVAEAEDILNTLTPDAMIVDVNLPDGNALALIDSFGQTQRLEGVPFIVITGQEKGTYRNPLLLDWILKPLDSRRLTDALRLVQNCKTQLKILIVDDDDHARKVVKAQLSSLRAECLEATSGDEALELIRAVGPDLVILDVTMPGLDGFAVVDIMRSEQLFGAPLIIYTGHELTARERQELSLGMTRYLTKTRTSTEGLLDNVKDLLESTILAKNEICRENDLALISASL